MEIIIEEISRGRKLLGRHKFLKDTVTVGRGYQNDIIVDDPHTCAEHMSINFDGENWVINDTESVNGSFIANGKTSADNHVVQSGDIISFGKSQIRILFPNHPVLPSVAFNPFEDVINYTRNPFALAVSILLFTCVSAYMIYLNKVLEVTFTQLLVPAIGMTLLFTLWPVLVGIVSHLTKHDARILSQLGVCFLFFNLMWISDITENIISFNLSGNWPLTVLVLALPAMLSFSLFWFNCSIGFHMTEKRKVIISALLTILLFGGSILVGLSNKPEFSALPRYNATLMTPNFLITPSTGVDSFIENSNALFESARKEAKEKALEK